MNKPTLCVTENYKLKQIAAFYGRSERWAKDRIKKHGIVPFLKSSPQVFAGADLAPLSIEPEKTSEEKAEASARKIQIAKNASRAAQNPNRPKSGLYVTTDSQDLI